MEKLKFELVNGYGVLVDENADVNVGDLIYNTTDKEIHHSKGKWKADPKSGVYIILFADTRLNLEGVPVFEWEDIQVVRLATKSYRENREAPPDSETIKLMKPYINGFIEGYKANKAEYTKEEFENALAELAAECLAFNGTVHGPDDASKWIKAKQESLKKYPKYVVMETKKEMCECAFEQEKDICIYPNCLTYKLFTNSQGKQEGIIKELIW